MNTNPLIVFFINPLGLFFNIWLDILDIYINKKN